LLECSALVVDVESLVAAATQWVRAYAAVTIGAGEEEDDGILQYADYAQWQFELFESQENQEGETSGDAYSKAWRSHRPLASLEELKHPRPCEPFQPHHLRRGARRA
jgi:hypothetical protein